MRCARHPIVPPSRIAYQPNVSPNSTKVSSPLALHDLLIVHFLLLAVLSYYGGSHNYHNFTSQKDSHDASAQRYIISIECGQPLQRGALEFVVVHIKGQRCERPKSSIDSSIYHLSLSLSLTCAQLHDASNTQNDRPCDRHHARLRDDRNAQTLLPPRPCRHTEGARPWPHARRSPLRSVQQGARLR